MSNPGAATPPIPLAGDCWPNVEQDALLQAALLEGPLALAAWRKWKATANIDRLDAGSYRLLPLLYRNLRAQGVQDPFVERLKGTYRLTWYENRLAFHWLADLLQTLHSSGIETMILKGVALVLLHYEDHGVRPMGDLDLHVRTDDARAALDVLRRSGWQADEETIETRLRHKHASELEHSDGRKIDLHWYVLPEGRNPGANDDFWAGAVPVTLVGVPTLTLNPTDQLLHVCVHGARWSRVPSFRWAADAMAILNTAGKNEMDWDRLLAQAEKRRLILPLRDTMHYLQARLQAPIPPRVMRALQRLPTSAVERVRYANQLRAPGNNPWRGTLYLLPHSWLDYLQAGRGKGWVRRVWGFPAYLQYRWRLESRWQVPSYALNVGSKKLWQASTWHLKRLGKALLR